MIKKARIVESDKHKIYAKDCQDNTEKNELKLNHEKNANNVSVGCKDNSRFFVLPDGKSLSKEDKNAIENNSNIDFCDLL